MTAPDGGSSAVVRSATGEDGVRRIQVEVVDTGIGIPATAVPNIFTEFYRAPNARNFSKDGTGRGLAFAARAVQVMGGSIEVGPAPTGGTRAMVTMPCLDPDSVRGAGAAPAGSDSGQSLQSLGHRQARSVNGGP